MNLPEQQQIDHWIKTALEGLSQTEEDFKNGFYEQENIPIQSVHTGTALFHVSLGRAKFLNGEPIEEVRTEFAKASQCIMKSFKMAYDESDPNYVGDKWPPKNPHYGIDPIVEAKWSDPVYGQVSWANVSETWAIKGMNYSLISGDFDLSCSMASWFQDRPDGYKIDIDVNRYTHALSLTIQELYEKAQLLLETQFKDYENKPPKSAGDKNYYTLINTLMGIIKKDEEKFNEGLLSQLKFYQSQAQGELKDTTEEFICNHAVALANLGIKSGLKVTVEYDTLPKGLLIKP